MSVRVQHICSSLQLLHAGMKTHTKTLFVFGKTIIYFLLYPPLCQPKEILCQMCKLGTFLYASASVCVYIITRTTRNIMSDIKWQETHILITYICIYIHTPEAHSRWTTLAFGRHMFSILQPA